MLENSSNLHIITSLCNFQNDCLKALMTCLIILLLQIRVAGSADPDYVELELPRYTGVSKSRYFVISISIKYSNFSRFYKRMGPFYKKFRCDKFGN